MPLISVIVPVYKVEPYIRRCVDSILNQTFANFELILVDDGSPDSCGTICDEYARADSRVHVIHQKNGGLSAARNAGLDWVFENSDSEWLSFIDSDDWIYPEFLERLLELTSAYSVNIGVSGYMLTDGMTENIPICENLKKSWIPELYFISHKTNAVVAWGKLYNKSCFRKVRYPVGKLHEDEYTTYKLLFAEKSIAATDMPLYFYFQNTAGITLSVWTPRRMDVIQALKEQTDFFKTNKLEKAYKQISCEYANTIIRHRELVKQSDLPEKEKKKYIRGLQKKLRKAVWDYRDIYVQQREWGFYVEAFRDLTSAFRRMMGVPQRK